MGTRKVTKVSFADGGEKGVSIGYKSYWEQGLKDTTTKDCKGLPAADFHAAMQAFKPHLLFLTEFMEAEKFSKVPSLTDSIDKQFRVCGVVLTGSEAKEGLMITGYKTLSNGKGFSFNSPNLLLSDEQYPFIEELKQCWDVLTEEVDAYIKGKQSMKQLELIPAEAGEPAPNS
jgi:hypothetical protein